jgi:hypothetical protein
VLDGVVQQISAGAQEGTWARTLHAVQRSQREKRAMLYTLIVILLAFWLLGLLTSYTLGGLIHALLVIAVVVLVLQLVTGRRPRTPPM